MGLVLLVFVPLLPWIALACLCAAAYYTRLLTNASVIVVRSLLKRSGVIKDGDGCVVEPCPGGVVLRDVVVPDKLLELATGSVTVQSVSIKRLQLLWPTSSAALTLVVTGAAVRVLQRRTALKVPDNAPPLRRHSGKLNALEALLWDGRQHPGFLGWRERQLQLLQFMVALALRNISVFVSDTEFQYQQTGDPVPVLKIANNDAEDVVLITIRTVDVSPVVSTDSQSQHTAGLTSGRRARTRGKSETPLGECPAHGSGRSSASELALRSRLYHWRNVSALFPRIQALYNWLDTLIAKFHQVDDCNGSRVSVAGVTIYLMSKSVCLPKRDYPAGQQQISRQQNTGCRPSGSLRPRGRSGVLGPRPPVLTRVPKAAKASATAGPAGAGDWDFVAVLLRQWSMQVAITVGPQTKQSGDDTRSPQRLAQSLAVHFQGTFGIHGHRRCANEPDVLANDAQQPSAAARTGSFSTAPVGTPSSSSAQRVRLDEQQRPSGMTQFWRAAVAQPSPSQRQSFPSPSGGSAQPVDGGTAGASAAGFVIHVDVALKAFIPEVTPEGAVQLLRMVDRILIYEKYSSYWSRRPNVSVSQFPAAWWQHAGHAIINDCREHFPLRKMRDLLARRAEYISAYKELHSLQHGFNAVTYQPRYELSDKYRKVIATLKVKAGVGESSTLTAGYAAAKPVSSARGAVPRQTSIRGGSLHDDRSEGMLQDGSARRRHQFPSRKVVYLRPKPTPSRIAELVDKLVRLESQLPLGPVMCNRAFVALWHSEKLARSAEVKTRWLEAMDVVSNFVDAIPNMDDEEEPDSNQVHQHASAGGSLGSARSDKPHRVSTTAKISLSIDCPRLGLKLVNKRLQFPGAVQQQGEITGAPSESAKRSADVLAIMLEGIRFSMPDIYRIHLQAATVKASIFGGETGSPSHMLIIPASRECVELYGTKLDLSAAEMSSNFAYNTSATLQQSFSGMAKSWASEGAIYPDAPISIYLSRYKVRLAAVEIALSNPPFVVACARFLDTMVHLRATRQQTQSSRPATDRLWPSTSLHSLVMDSYTRNSVRLPSSMAVFMPKLQLFCPMVSARWMLSSACTPSIGGIAGQHSDAVVVVVLTSLRATSRYVHTCYASLVKSMSAQTHMEMYFQLQPRSDIRAQTANALLSWPQRGQFGKIWLHPDDVELAFPYDAVSSVLRDTGNVNDLPSKHLGRAKVYTLQHQGTLPSSATIIRRASKSSEVVKPVQHHCSASSYPFLPLLKIRSVSALALNQVPYEPAVPGTTTAHQTVGVHSIMAWFSPWHAEAVSGAVDSLLTHPVVAYWRSIHEVQPSTTEASATTPSDSSAPASSASVDGSAVSLGRTSPRPGNDAVSLDGGSSISLLVDVPLLTVSCYAEMPKTFSSLDLIERKLQTMQSSGSEMQLACWVTQQLMTQKFAATDPVLQWGIRLAPLLTMNIANLRSGMRLTRRNSTMARLLTTGVQVSDHQARLKRQLYVKIWLPNAGKGSPGPAVNGIVHNLLPEDDTAQLLGPLATRGLAVRDFARDRRRAALCLPSSLASKTEKRGQVRQQWRRLLEIQLLQRASDFAMFLLSSAHGSAEQLHWFGSESQPLAENYRRLFQVHLDSMLGTHEAPSETCSPVQPSTPNASSPFRTTGTNLPDAGPRAVGTEVKRPRILDRLRSMATLSSVTAYLYRESSQGSSPGTSRRKPTSLAQMLGAVNNHSVLHAAALRHNNSLLTSNVSLPDVEADTTPARGPFSTGMSRFVENSHQPCSSASRHNPLSQSPINPPAEAVNRESSCNHATSSPATNYRQSIGSIGSSGARNVDGPNSLRTPSPPVQSAFVTAQEESRAAAFGSQRISVRTHSCVDNSSNEGETKLGFVQAFRYSGVQQLEQRRLAAVNSMPFPNPVITVDVTRASGENQATALHVSCQHLLSCVGVHSFGTVLHMLVQMQQAIHPSAYSPAHRARTHPKAEQHAATASMSRGFKTTVDLQFVRVKVVMEESPRRLPCHGRSAKPGLTYLTSVDLSQLLLTLAPSRSREGSSGFSVNAAVNDVAVLDLQGCIEHRNVLVAKSVLQPPANDISGPGQQRHSGNGSGQSDDHASAAGANTCRLNFAYNTSSSGVPPLIRVTVHDPCITWLRRYSNNLVYAVGSILRAYHAAVQEDATEPVQGVSSSSINVERPSEHSIGSTSSSLSPVVMIEAFNLKGILPGGAAARHGPIRRAVHNEALALEARFISVCLPAKADYHNTSGRLELNESAVWMTSTADIDALIGTSLRLADKHFPEINQQAPSDEHLDVHASQAANINEGCRPAGHPRQAVRAASPTRASSPGNRVQKQLHAAKATFIDPLKEILKDASTKRTTQHGEMGLVLIDEDLTGPTSESKPGYLSIDDDGVRCSTAAAGALHSTITVRATDGPAANVPELPSLLGPVPLGGFHEIHQPGTSGGSPTNASVDTAEKVQMAAATSHGNDICNQYPPMVLISVDGLSASSGIIVPYDNITYSRKRRMCSDIPSLVGRGKLQEDNHPACGLSAGHSSTGERVLPADLCNVILGDQYVPGQQRERQVDNYDPEVGSALHLLADIDLQAVQHLIEPVQLKGVIFRHKRHGAIQVHFSALGAMEATLGPQQYQRMIQVLTDNVTEAYTCFNVGGLRDGSKTQQRPTVSPSTVFTPRPGQLPFFHLTVDWSDQFRAVLESNPAWWNPSQEEKNSVEACIQGCFTQCSFGLMMMHKTNDMFLAFYSQQMHVADVRIGVETSGHRANVGVSGDPGLSAVYPFDASSAFDATGGKCRSGGARLHPEEPGLGRMSYTTGTDGEEQEDIAWTNEHLDAASIETPDGQNVQPVVDDQLNHTFPGRSAVVTLLRSNISLPADESAHLDGGCTASGDPIGSGECPRDAEHHCVRVSFAMIHNGTMANEVELCHTLVQWPYLTEMSLVSSIISIFVPTWGHPTAGAEAFLRLAASPWFYFNLLLTNSQVYLPVLAPHLRRLTYGWREASSLHSGGGICLTPELLLRLLASQAEDNNGGEWTAFASAPSCDADQQTASANQRSSVPRSTDPFSSAAQRHLRSSKTTVPSLEPPVLSGNWGTLSMRHMADVADKTLPPRLERMGVVVSMAALRVGYFGGGDGDITLKVDLRNAAGFIRHSTAQVTNWLLPIRSMMLEYNCSTPLVEESLVLQKYIFAARVIERRRLRLLHMQQPGNASSLQLQHASAKEFSALERNALGTGGSMEPNNNGFTTAGPGDDLGSVVSRVPHNSRPATAQDLLIEAAAARAAALLKLHKLPLPSSSASKFTMDKLLVRKTAVSTVMFELDVAAIRASFSNIPLWHALMDDATLALDLIRRNNGLFSRAPLARAVAPAVPGPSSSKEGVASEATIERKATWNFRPSKMAVNASIKSLGLVLCDDKPKSYGAPDVLTAAMEQVAFQYNMERRFFDHLPEQSGSISLRLASQFLNNSTGRWEHLLEPWPAELHLSDPINPVFKSSRTKYILVSSSELMKITFHPSCLLTLGDTNAFIRRLSNRAQEEATVVADLYGGPAAPVAEDPPSVREQMALSGSIMMRVPQRYLIQNLTGLTMSYWAPKEESDVQPATIKRILLSGNSEELAVTPTTKQVKIVGPGGVILTRLQAQVIVLNFEGSWMPIPDVSVDVVGKYCYDLNSPTDDRHVPVVVDVALVGRTKILNIHSALYIQNSTSLRLSFRLHFPSAMLARQVAQSRGDVRLPGEQDIRLRPLKPGEGRYLPVVAALGGTLYLEARSPSGKPAFAYAAAEHDVIRLCPAVNDMLSQAGFIATGPLVEGLKGHHGTAPLHFAVKVRVKMRTEYSYTTFRSMEVPGPGMFAKASRPLEASIKICPTVVLTNTLPYHMEGYLLTLSGAGEPGHMGAIGAQAPNKLASGSAQATSTVVSTLPLSESRRLVMKARRSEAHPDPLEISTAAQDKIINNFERSLLPLLSQKADQLWDVQQKSRAKHGAEVTSSKKKFALLALLRYELRWTAKRNAKETELLIRTDTEPSDKITWQELESFIEWAKDNIRAISVPPGETRRLYLDMHKQLVLCVRVPERDLVCTRPVVISNNSRTSSNGEVELPDFMRLDYIGDTAKTFKKVLSEMQSLNRTEPPKPLLKVVNQKIGETAAAVGDKVANTMRDVLDAFTTQHSVKERVQQEPAVDAACPTSHAPSMPAVGRESITHWHGALDKIVRVELFVMPGSWQCVGSGSSLSQHKQSDTTGNSSEHHPQDVRELQEPATLSDVVSGSHAKPNILLEGSNATVGASSGLPPASELPLAAVDDHSTFPAVEALSTAMVKPNVAIEDGVPVAFTSLPAPTGIATAVTVVPQRSSVPLPSASHLHGVRATSPRLHAVRSIFGKLRASVVQRFQDPKMQLLDKANDGGVHASAALPAASPVDTDANEWHVRVRFTYRPEQPLAAAPDRGTKCESPPSVAFGLAGGDSTSVTELSSAVSSAAANFRGTTGLNRIPDGSGTPSAADDDTGTCDAVRLRLRIVPASPSRPEHVRVQFVIAVVRPGVRQDGLWASVSKAWHGFYGTASSSTGRRTGVGPGNASCEIPPRSGEPEVARGDGRLQVTNATWGGFPPHPSQLSSNSRARTTKSMELIAPPSTPRAIATPEDVALLPSPSPVSLASSVHRSSSSRRSCALRKPTVQREGALAAPVLSDHAAADAASARAAADQTVSSGSANDGETVGPPQPRSPHRPDAVWSENAAYKCGSSVSTASGSDLPVRLLPHDIPQGASASKLCVGGGRCITSAESSVRIHAMETPFSWACEPLSEPSKGQIAKETVGAGRCEAAQLETGVPAGGQLSGLCSVTPPTLSEGYAQLEFFNENIGSITSRHVSNKHGRRSSTLSSSLSLRRGPSKSSRSAESIGRPAVSHAVVDRSSAGLLGVSSDSASNGQQDIYRAGSSATAGFQPWRGSYNGKSSGTTPDEDLGTRSRREGDEDLPVITESATSTGVINGGEAAPVVEREISAAEPVAPHGRRFTADDITAGQPYHLEHSSFGLSFLVEPNAVHLPSQLGRKSVSEKRVGERVYGWRHRHSRERTASGRLLQSSLGRGVGKKGVAQPSYKAFLFRENRPLTSNAITLAKNALQVVPDLARNMGEALVDGGQQVIQGVPQIASKVADTIISGGQGVKEKVVESTEQAIALAKPKIKKGLMTIAWRATEAMRKRKQGAEDLVMFDDPKLVRGKRKREVERAPRVLLLSLHNSLATKEDEYVCRLSLYAPYWVDNRTGFHLLFKDLDAPAGIDNLPFLLWHPVQVPGTKADAFSCEATDDAVPVHGSSTTRQDGQSMPASGHNTVRRGSFTPIWPKPALLNDQSRTKFRVTHGNERDRWQYSETGFCMAFTIATTNQKYSVDIKGFKGEVNMSKVAAVDSSKYTPTSSRRSSMFSGMYKSSQSVAADGLKKGISNQPVDQVLQGQPNTLDRIPLSNQVIAPAEQVQEGQHSRQEYQEALLHVRGPVRLVQASHSSQHEEHSYNTGALTQETYATCLTADQPVTCSRPHTIDVVGVGASPSARANRRELHEGSTRLPPPVRTTRLPRNPLESVSEITPVKDDGDAPQQTSVTAVVAAELYDMQHNARCSLPASYQPPVFPSQPVAPFSEPGDLRIGGATPAVEVILDAHPASVSCNAHDEIGSGPVSKGLEKRPDDTQQAKIGLAAAASQPPSALAEHTKAGSKGKPTLSHKASSGNSIGPGGHDGQKATARQRPPRPKVFVCRLYQFAVEVWAAPSDTVFARTKVVTVKNKYIILNATGLAIDCKQKGTPDPEPIPVNDNGYGNGVRFSRRLDNNARAAWHWDNADAEHELMIRPAGDDWDWSGSFKLPEIEDYFGLRIRHRHRNEYVIIPVNISVGPAGSVLITLKSKGSVPPYMIINRCRDVIIRLKQADYSRHGTGDCWSNWDEIQPGANQVPFAWDEPRLRHVVKIVASGQRGPDPDPGSAIDVDLDAVDANTTIYVQSRSTRSWALAAQLDGRERAKFLTDNAKKVYVTVYADGPTRVLCFSEDRSGAAYVDDENSLMNLSYRLQRVAMRLKEVDQRLMQQLGASWDSDLGARQESEMVANGSVGTGASGGSPEMRLQSRFGAARTVPRHVGSNLNIGLASKLPGANSAGASTPLLGSRLGSTVAVTQASPASFAFQRIPSIGTGQRNASAYTFTTAGPNRNPSINAAPLITNAAQRLPHGRSPSNQSYVPVTAKAAFAVDAFPPLFESAPFTEDLLAQGLEALPAFGGDVDLPIGGDLTVILRYVEGLSAGLDNNENMVAVEAKMAVLSSTPHLGGSLGDQVTASWTQIVDGVSTGSTDSNSTGAGVVGVANTARFTMQDHTEIFRDVAASSELQVEFYIAKGTEQAHTACAGRAGARPPRVNKQLPAHNSRQVPSPVRRGKSNPNGADAAVPTTIQRLTVSARQFAGCVRVPLVFTLGREKGQIWRLPLERKAGSQLVRGFVGVSFEWSMTSEGMLVREVATLERILDEKVELLAQLNPLTPTASAAFMQDHLATSAVEASGGSSSAGSETVNTSMSLTLAGGGAATSTRPFPVKKSAKTLSESYYVNLELSVMKISGLLPREGLRASLAASVYGRQAGGNIVSVAMLPRAAVSMSVGSESRIISSSSNSISPRFTKNSCIFKNVPLGGKVTVKVLDHVSGSYHKLLAEGEVELSHIPGTDPIYAWLALTRRRRGSRSQRALAQMQVLEEAGETSVQVLMRIKINKPQVHGVSMDITLDLAGIGLCAKTSLEELFNYTMQKIRAFMVQTRTDLQASLAIATIQLDNQMLEAKNPVVLAPADVSGSSSLAQVRRRHKARVAQRFGSTNPIMRLASQDPSLQDPLLTFQVIYNQASSNHAMMNSKGQLDSVGILAFKKVVLELGPLDFSADQEFIEGVIAYLNGLPLEDFRQDRAWQHKIDAMQGGTMAPTEDLAVIERRDKSKTDALNWLKMKEAKELELLLGQSSMWFYLEEFYLSDIFINVTLALSSSFNTSGNSSSNGSGRDEEQQRSMLRGLLGRVAGSNGFQLINVTNAPILLEYVELQNHLVNRVSLVNKLYRHYSWIALAQARKVLGGAGPAIAAIPASILWASLALFDLGQDVAAKRVNPLVVPTRIGYVTFTVLGQVIGVLSRTMCALMSVLPPRFSSDNANLSDPETAQRFGIKPQTVMDALYLCQRDVVLGLMSAGFGFIHDPAAGARWKSGLASLGIPMGFIKASVGLGMRPAAGAVEATSKLLQGVGLVCLGKRGIQGKLVRRVQAPGLVINDVVQAARASAAQAAIQATLIAAWQAALPAISSSLADDEVVDVVAARTTRVVLLTNKHLAYLYARRQVPTTPSAAGDAASFTVTYRVKWIIRNDHIDNIRGLERGYAVSVEYHQPVKFGRLSLKLPLHKGMRTATAEGHKDLIFRLNRHIGRTASEAFSAPIAAVIGIDAGATAADLQSLRIMQPPNEGARAQGCAGAPTSGL